MLRALLETEGIVAISAHASDLRRGQLDFSGFIAEHPVGHHRRPRAAVRSQLAVLHLRNLPLMENRKFVLTSTNPAAG